MHIEAIIESLKGAIQSELINGKISLTGLSTAFTKAATLEEELLEVPDLTEYLSDYLEYDAREVRLVPEDLVYNVTDDILDVYVPIDDLFGLSFSYNGQLSEKFYSLPKYSLNPYILSQTESVPTMYVNGSVEYVHPICESVTTGLVLVLHKLNDECDYLGDYEELGFEINQEEYLRVERTADYTKLITTDVRLLRSLLMDEVIAGYLLLEDIAPRIINAKRMMVRDTSGESTIYAKAFVMQFINRN